MPPGEKMNLRAGGKILTGSRRTFSEASVSKAGSKNEGSTSIWQCGRALRPQAIGISKA